MFSAWRRNSVGHRRRLAARDRFRRIHVECLEDRRLLSAVPFGALPHDTGEYMLGDVLVSVVLMESSENVSVLNPNSETWTPQTIEAAKQKVMEGIDWWEQTLGAEFPGTTMPLQFHYDFTHADNPVLTDYEPIHLASSYFQYWIYDFLDQVGYGATRDFTQDIRSFNHAQRLAHGTDWAFTVFVVNDENDADGMFGGGPFLRAFAYAGGQFMVSPAGRPASTFAHEAGHMFWARDEYQGGGSYFDHRGYYNTQNTNAWNNPTPGFVQAASIMDRDHVNLNPPQLKLTQAWNSLTSSTSSLEMIGWRDTSGNGIFDVLDVPHWLQGGGYLDAAGGVYRFQGDSAVQTLPNRNSSGLQSDITINRISRAEYRIDGGSWQTAATFGDQHAVELDLFIPLPTSGVHTIDIRTVDDRTGVTSNVFSGRTDELTAVQKPGINGFVWNDVDGNGQFDAGERPLAGWTIRLVDAEGEALQLADGLEPDLYAPGTPLDQVHAGVEVRAMSHGAWRGVVATTSAQAATGDRVLGHLNAAGAEGSTWNRDVQLRIDFASPVSAVRLDAIGAGAAEYARLAVYDAAGNLLERVTTGPLVAGEFQTMSIDRAVPEIAYAIAREHGNSTVMLDNLRFGPETETVTDRWGGYHLSGVPAGEYRVQAIAPPYSEPFEQIRTVTLGEGESVGSVDFAARHTPISWQNPVDPADVLGDGRVSALDVLTVINYINSRNGDPSLPPPPYTPGPYYDVNGDGYVTAADVLFVINRLNNPGDSSIGSDLVDIGDPGDQSDGDAPVAEGEPMAGHAMMGEELVSQPLERRFAESWWRPVSPVSPEVVTARRDAVPPLPMGPAESRSASDVYFRDLGQGPRRQVAAEISSDPVAAPLDELLLDLAAELTARVA